MMKAIRRVLIITTGCFFFLNLMYIINSGSNTKLVFSRVQYPNATVLVYMTSESNKFHNETRIMRETVAGDLNIFFLETSHIKKSNEIILNSRQGCAVESAARMNPTIKVHLYIFNTPRWNYSNDTQSIISQLTTYKNVVIRHISLETYFKHSPMEEWWKTTNALNTSHWFTSHISDVLRYLTLWKFGGIYLDLDVIVKSSLEHFKSFVGAEDSLDVAAGVLGFDKTEIGRRYADACLLEIMTNFRGDDWGYNGPGVITRVLKRICPTEIISEMTEDNCGGFKIFPPSAFYPIAWRNWRQYFRTDDINNTMKAIKNALAIHVWNKHSHSSIIKVGSKVPYEHIASEYCPRIYGNTGDTF